VLAPPTGVLIPESSGVVLDAKQYRAVKVDQHATQTEVAAFAVEITSGIGLIESCRVIRETKFGRMSELLVRLSD